MGLLEDRCLVEVGKDTLGDSGVEDAALLRRQVEVSCSDDRRGVSGGAGVRLPERS